MNLDVALAPRVVPVLRVWLHAAGAGPIPYAVRTETDLHMDSIETIDETAELEVEETAAEEIAEEAAETPRFSDLGLSQAVLDAVADMGYETPTPVQAASIPEVLAGRDLLAAAQTGTGKTAAFLLPTMDKLGHVVPPAKKGERGRRRRNEARGRGPLMLVITPTRELAQQIDEVCSAIAKRTGHTAVTVVGGLSYGPQKQALSRGCDILVATPGRLVDLIEQGAANLDEVGVLVLDEADRMLDMGFLPQVRTIVNGCREDRQTLLFSATLDDERVGAITDLVREPARVEIAPVTSTAETVDQFVVPVSTDEKNTVLTEVLKKEGPERVIVFVRTKRRADTCVRRLARSGFKCEAIHGDRSQAQRQRALQAFRDGRVQILVATDVLARGIDVSDVRYVVNFDVPEEPTDYIHRIGRTGRAGEEGWSLTFVTKQDVSEFYDIEALMGKTADLYDAAGINLGADAPRVDPDRVPASHAPTKKEKKRRKQKAKRQESAARRAAAKENGEKARPARPKRSGKVRVHTEDETDTRKTRNAEAAAEEAAAAPAANRAARRAAKFGEDASRSRDPHRGGRDGNRGSRGGTGKGAGNKSHRDRRSGGRGGVEEEGRTRNGERVRFNDNGRREGWRNFDEADYGRGRNGGRGGRGSNAGGGSRPGRNGGRGNASRGGSRRVGDRGGKR